MNIRDFRQKIEEFLSDSANIQEIQEIEESDEYGCFVATIQFKSGITGEYKTYQILYWPKAKFYQYTDGRLSGYSHVSIQKAKDAYFGK